MVRPLLDRPMYVWSMYEIIIQYKLIRSTPILSPPTLRRIYSTVSSNVRKSASWSSVSPNDKDLSVRNLFHWRIFTHISFIVAARYCADRQTSSWLIGLSHFQLNCSKRCESTVRRNRQLGRSIEVGPRIPTRVGLSRGSRLLLCR